MSQRQDRELQLKFWSKTTERNVVSVAVLTQSLQSLQRAVHLLGMHHEGKEVRQRARLSDEIKKRYVVLCQLPEEGSYTVPVMIGDTSQSLFAPVAVEAVTGNFHDLLSAIADKDGVRIRAVLPDHSYRISILRALRKMEPPKRSGVELALQSRSGDDLLVPTKVAKFVDDVIVGHTADATVTTITGRLIGIDFDRNRLRLHYPPTSRELQCFYQPEVEHMLLDNPREFIQVVGQVVLDAEREPERIIEVEKIIEVDLSVIAVDGFDVGDKRVVAKQPVTFQPVLDETSQCYVLQDAPFGIQLLAGFREELETDLYDELDFLWRQYAAESDDELTEDALDLKQQMLGAFRVAR